MIYNKRDFLAYQKIFLIYVSSGQAAAYSLDEVTGALNLSHRLKFVNKDPLGLLQSIMIYFLNELIKVSN